MQLHRDTTVQSLTSAPSLVEGKIVWMDSPLVRAVIHGRVLVLVCPSDLRSASRWTLTWFSSGRGGQSAPRGSMRVERVDRGQVHATCRWKKVLYHENKGLNECWKSWQLSLNRIMSKQPSSEENVVLIHPKFRVIALANRYAF